MMRLWAWTTARQGFPVCGLGTEQVAEHPLVCEKEKERLER